MLKKNYGIKVSPDIIRTRAILKGIVGRRIMIKPLISRVQAKKRLIFAKSKLKYPLSKI